MAKRGQHRAKAGPTQAPADHRRPRYCGLRRHGDSQGQISGLPVAECFRERLPRSRAGSAGLLVRGEGAEQFWEDNGEAGALVGCGTAGYGGVLPSERNAQGNAG
uniref:(northern house mosquito) hypothetical protein n=1 Tax=Culex pipiens TaxID=7175 RepID=A0A8D8FL88_CULPI